METSILDAVESLCNLNAVVILHELGDDALEFLLANLTLVVRVRSRKCLVEQCATESGLTQLAVETNLHLGAKVESDLLLLVENVECKQSFRDRTECTALTHGTIDLLGQVVQTDDHVLGRNCNWATI